MPDDSVHNAPTGPGCGHSCNCGRANADADGLIRDPKSNGDGVSRRSFIKTLGASAAVSSLSATSESRATALLGREVPKSAAMLIDGPEPVDVTLNINGKPLAVKVEPATTLLEALRFHLNLTGSKEICDRGACGGCSVIVDGKLVNSCMMLALDAVGTQVTTVEGLARDGKLDPVQESFVRHDGLQCGYCTPGLVMACRALLNDNPKPTLEEIKKGLSGNLCRCGTYTNIFNAALEASGQAPIMDQKMEGA